MWAGRYHWSNGAHSPRFGKVHAICSVPFLGLLLFPSWTLLVVAIATLVILTWVEVVKKMTIPAFLRSLNIAVTGNVKMTVNVIHDIFR